MRRTPERRPRIMWANARFAQGSALKPRLHWNKVWQCWSVSNPLALPRAACTIAAHAAHQFNVANDRSNGA